jgi:hypothetical protein
MSKTKTKAQLQQEIKDLQKQIEDLTKQLSLKQPVAILGNNKNTSDSHIAKPPVTDGINNSDERVREPIHEMDPLPKDPNPPTYKQLSKLAYYYATYKLPLDVISDHKPTNNLEAAILLTNIHTYVSDIPYNQRPYNDYQSSVSRLTKDELMLARQFKQQATLCYLIAKYGSFTSCKLPFCKDFKVTEDTYTILINKQTEKLKAFHTKQRQADNNNL